MEQVYEGKSKVLFSTDNSDELLMVFKDIVTAGNGEKISCIRDKGYLNSIISAKIYSLLDVPTHFIKMVNDTTHLVKKVDIFPVEFIFRNIAAGSFIKRLPVREGANLRENGLPFIEFCYKSDEYNDPFISERHILHFNWMSQQELNSALHYTHRIVNKLISIFSPFNIEVVDGKFEFGRDSNGNVILADEISPDGLRLWQINEDIGTYKSFDKDLFRKNLGGEVEAYTEIARMLKVV